MKIYTKGGDKGTTGIHGGDRVHKDDIRIETNGCLDELNSMIGIVRAYLCEDDELQPILYRIQREMMVLMSHVATPSHKREINPNMIATDLVEFCEQHIDSLSARMTPSSHFILPGGSLAAAHIHMARTLARRAERRLWSLHRIDELPEVILVFLNRLSDLLFIMARFELFRQGGEEEKWHNFLYKKKKNS